MGNLLGLNANPLLPVNTLIMAQLLYLSLTVCCETWGINLWSSLIIGSLVAVASHGERSVKIITSRWSHYSRKTNHTVALLLIAASKEIEGSLYSIIEHAMHPQSKLWLTGLTWGRFCQAHWEANKELLVWGFVWAKKKKRKADGNMIKAMDSFITTMMYK